MTDEEWQALAATHSTTIDGRKTPELVPFDRKARPLFDHYNRIFRRALSLQLSAEDDALLSHFSDIHPKAREQDFRDDAVSQVAICAGAEQLSGIQIAETLAVHFQSSEDARIARYQGWIDQLSVDGRRIVRDFIDQNIKPITHKADLRGFAAAAPEYFKSSQLEGCRWMREALAKNITIGPQRGATVVPPAPGAPRSKTTRSESAPFAVSTDPFP